MPIRSLTTAATVASYAPEPVLAQAPVPMLAQLDAHLPTGGVWRYEPKLDGFRGLLWHRTSAMVQLLGHRPCIAWWNSSCSAVACGKVLADDVRDAIQQSDPERMCL